MQSQLKRLLTLFFFAIATSTCGRSQADIISILQIDSAGPGTFSLFLLDDNTASTAGRFGIASYGVPLVSAGTFTYDHNSPTGIASSFSPVGFSLFRSTDVIAPVSASLVRASQDTVTPTPHRVPNFGIAAGNLANHIGGNTLLVSEQPIFGVPLLIASGNYVGAAPTINTASIDFGANVFSTAGLSTTQAASIRVAAVPEPSAGVMGVCIGALAVFRRRRATKLHARVGGSTFAETINSVPDEPKVKCPRDRHVIVAWLVSSS